MRCRACYQHGHNRVSCPTEKARIENLRSTYGSDHYAVAHYDTRNESRKNKSCSYCGGRDHNRRNCSPMAEDRARLANVQASYRRRYIAALCETGFVPGSLVRSKSLVWGGANGCEDFYVESLYLITAPMYDRINFDTYGTSAMMTKHLNSDDGISKVSRQWQVHNIKNYMVVPAFQNDIKQSLENEYRRFPEDRFDIVIAPGCIETFQDSIPATFLNGTDNLDNYFQPKGTLAKDRAQFLNSIEEYENTNRYNWIEKNSFAYSSTIQDLSAFEAAIAANHARVSG